MFTGVSWWFMEPGVPQAGSSQLLTALLVISRRAQADAALNLPRHTQDPCQPGSETPGGACAKVFTKLSSSKKILHGLGCDPGAH